ncbi:MAG: C10 family peptidase [Paramuribaculum sp.]|nr:C10 family peptidase [Paramuribaculum sp.]
MGKFVFLLSLSACAMICSCEQEKDDPSDVVLAGKQDLASILITKPDTARIVNSERAAEIASEFFNKYYPVSRSEMRTIKEVRSINNSEGIPQMYVINFVNNEGFVIVSATKEYYPVLAQGNEGNFNLNDTCSPAFFWLSDQLVQISQCDELPDSVKTDIANSWSIYNSEESLTVSRSDYPEKPQVYYDSLRMWSLDEKYQVYYFNDYMQTEEYRNLSDYEKHMIETNIVTLGNSNYGPKEDVTIVLTRNYYHPNKYPTTLLKSKWGQGVPYNGDDENAPYLGCTTIAAGQIMRYHEWPIYYNWAEMPYGQPLIYATQTLRQFLLNLSKVIGVKYDGKNASATIDQVRSALEKNDYKVVKQDHNLSTVLFSIEYHEPVLMTGSGTSGHAWVCDGANITTGYHEIRIMTLEYRPTAYNTPSEMIEAYKITQTTSFSGYRLHMNWGWYGQADGFYLDNNMNPKTSKEQYYFNKNRRELLITPKKQ